MKPIELIPAIDLIDGKCVRLTKGDYASQKVYADDPVKMALRFEKLGFKRLHLVDLDGAKSRHVVNLPVLRRICEQTSLTVDFGGGVKTDEDIRHDTSAAIDDTSLFGAVNGGVAILNAVCREELAVFEAC